MPNRNNLTTLITREWLLLLVLAAPFVFLVYVWPQIPDRVPIHFNASFTPDGWMSKDAGTLLLPLSNVFTILLVRVWFRFDPKMAKCSTETREMVGRVLQQCLMASALLLSCLSIAIVWAAWGRIEPVIQVMLYGIPLLLTVMGNGMGKLRPNYTIGIRLPWTLRSAAVWNRTHRFAGTLLVTTGTVLFGLVALGMDKGLFLVVLLSALAIWTVAVVAYAFAQSRSETAAIDHGSAIPPAH